MKSVITIFFSFLFFVSCKKADVNNIDLNSLIKESGNDSMIAQVVYYNIDGSISAVVGYTYDPLNRLIEINSQKRDQKYSYKLTLEVSDDHDTISCKSTKLNYTTYFKNNRIIQKHSNIQDIYFRYNNTNEMIEEQYVSKGETDTATRLFYYWKDENITSADWVNVAHVGQFRYDVSKPFMIGDAFYIYFLERFGRIPFKTNRHQCVNEVKNEGMPLASGNNITYEYDHKGRISGYTISFGGFVKYIYR